ncbi:MAG TPA: hypothetical protein VF134_02995 [Candidatus Dormibacteraeota bacterium]
MRLIATRARALAVLLGTGGSLLIAVPVHAETSLSLSLIERWANSQAGSWTPYVATVHNDGSTDFVGDVYLTPSASRNLPSSGFPDYRQRVNVAHGTQRSVTFYVIEPPSGYTASLLDTSGKQVLGAVTASGLASGAYTVAVLSDQQQAGQRIEALRPLGESGGYGASAGLKVSTFASVQAFPTNAVYLSGLHALVIDNFDVSTLSDAQFRALRDFVGLGGSLVVTGGSEWRRTLLPLADKDFSPLHPQRSDQASLRPLADLAAHHTDLVVPIAAGELKNATVLLGAPNSPPLIVESAYGAGRIIALAFDPLAGAINGDNGGMDGFAWAVALDRALLSRTPTNANAASPPVGAYPQSGKPDVSVGGLNANPEQLLSILQATPAAAAPPVGLLGLMLVFYILVAGPINYLVLRAGHRRELMWVSVPLVAVLVTGIAYGAGFTVHGAQYFDNEVEILRLAPDGAIEVHSYHGVFPPHRGNFTVAMPANTLATTVLGSNSFVSSNETAVVDNGSRVQVELRDTAYSGMRTLQTLSVARPPLVGSVALEPHLRLASGRIQGTVKNLGDRPIQQLELVSGLGNRALIATDLAPHVTATVDSGISQPGAATAGSNGFSGVSQAPRGNSDQLIRDTMLQVGAGAVVDGVAGDWTLVGLTDSIATISVEGRSPSHTGIAALIQRVGLESVDTLAGNVPRPSLLLTEPKTGVRYDVYDLTVPPGYGGALKLSYFTFGVPQTASPVQPFTPHALAVYNWATGQWRELGTPVSSNGRTQTTPLDPGESAGGLVRVRVLESGYTVYSQNGLQLVSQ